MMIQLKKELEYCSSNKMISSHFYSIAIFIVIFFFFFKSGFAYKFVDYNSFWESYYFFFSLCVLSSVYISSTIGYQLIKSEGRYVKFLLQKKSLFDKVFTSKIILISSLALFFQILLLATFLFTTKYSLEQYIFRFSLTEILLLVTTNILFSSFTTIMVLALRDFSLYRQVTQKNLLNFILLAFGGVVIIFFNTYYMRQYYDFLFSNTVITYNAAVFTIIGEILLLVTLFPLLYNIVKKRFFRNY